MEGEIASLSSAQLEERIRSLAGHLNAANARFLALIAEFDRRQGWAEWGVKSCAHWLSWKCGIGVGAAREQLRTAHALAKLPRIALAMAEGRLSFSKVRAMTRVADATNEDYLLNIALCGTASHVETLVCGYRRALEAAELSREAIQQRNQSFYTYTDWDGSLVIRARVPAEVGALFLKALHAAEDSLPFEEDVSAETSLDARLTHRKRRSLALGMLAESFLASGPRELVGADRHQIVVHVDSETLKHSHAGRCEIEHGPSLAAETARRLACDASVIAIVENGKGVPLSVGRKTRTIPPAIRRALNARDKGCRFPGCPFKRYVDGHHVKHWAHGGETKLSNLVTLCRFHHRLVHEGQVLVQTLDDGGFRFLKPNGATFEHPLPPPTDWTALVAEHEASDLQITAEISFNRWTGERMDYGLAVAWLQNRNRATRDVSAETSRGQP